MGGFGKQITEFCTMERYGSWKDFLAVVGGGGSKLG